jgi:hypothetical protein
MFNFKITIVLVAFVLVLGGVTAASAQFNFGSALRVNVPSEFVVEDKVFPAGEYSIFQTPSTTDSSTNLILRGRNGRSMIMNTMIARSNEAAMSTHLVFDVIDGTHFLSKIWLKGEITANEIPKSSFERRLIAENKQVRQVVVSTSSEF